MLSPRRLARTARARAAGSGEDAGVTMTELVVTMTLMSLVGALTLGWMIGSTSASTRTTDSSIDTSNGREAASAWAAMLGVMAPPSVSTANARHLVLDATSVSFDAALGTKAGGCATTACTDTATSTVVLALRSGRIVRTVQNASGTQTDTLVPGAVTAAGCLFTAYDASGTALTEPGACTPADPDAVSRIDFSFVVTSTQRRTQTFGTTVTLPGTYR